jgi:hypothetical protein
MIKHVAACVLVCLLVLLSGCSKGTLDDLFKDPDLTEIRKALKTALPLSYAANAAMVSMEGTRLPNVSMVQTGDTSSVGAFIMEVTVDSTFPMPHGISGQGKITVAGFNARADMAMLTVMFTDMNVLQGNFTIQNVSTFPVVRPTGTKELIVVYADIDINAGSDTLFTVGVTQEQINAEFTRYETMKDWDTTVHLEEIAWVIRIQDQGTATDASDDRYIMSGGGQYVEAGSGTAELLQLSMVTVALSPQCTRNPLQGLAFVQNLGASTGSTGPVPELGHVFFTFHDNCDGQIEVTLATGSYIRALGTSMPLELDK